MSAEQGVGLRWLEEAAATYRGGGSHTTATAQATIGVGFLLLAVLDALEADPVNAAITREVNESMSRHPAGKKRPLVVADHPFTSDGVTALCAARGDQGAYCQRPAWVHRPCACGEPERPNSTHRTDGPCYSVTDTSEHP